MTIWPTIPGVRRFVLTAHMTFLLVGSGLFSSNDDWFLSDDPLLVRSPYLVTNLIVLYLIVVVPSFLRIVESKDNLPA